MSQISPEVQKLQQVLVKMVTHLLTTKPEDPIPHMIQFLEEQQGIAKQPLTVEEKLELNQLRTRKEQIEKRQSIAKAKEESKAAPKKKPENSDDDESDGSDSECDEVADLPMAAASSQIRASEQNQKARSSVSAEVFGKFNKKEVFVPTVIPKSEEIKQKIKSRLLQSFMFAALDENDFDVVVSAMDEKKVVNQEFIIKEGDAGSVLYIVEEGKLACYKNINGEEKHLKDYAPGEVFGELALLYNAPRAASIQAHSDSQLWVLDRNTFNAIVKEASQKRRERYEDFLGSVPILQSMDEYERSKIAEVIKEKTFQNGDFVIKEGEDGDVFYLIIEGQAAATKNNEQVKSYKEGDYFGERALLKNEPRAANVVAQSKLKVAIIDRGSFMRLLGPLDSILARNMEAYSQFM